MIRAFDLVRSEGDYGNMDGAIVSFNVLNLIKSFPSAHVIFIRESMRNLIPFGRLSQIPLNVHNAKEF